MFFPPAIKQMCRGEQGGGGPSCITVLLLKMMDPITEGPCNRFEVLSLDSIKAPQERVGHTAATAAGLTSFTRWSRRRAALRGALMETVHSRRRRELNRRRQTKASVFEEEP